MRPTVTATVDKRERFGKTFDSLLADEFVLSMRTRDAHRNVHGRNVSELRGLFQLQYEAMDAIVLDLSAKISMFGALPPRILANFLPMTRLNKHNERFTKQNQIIEALLDDHQSIIRALKNAGAGKAVGHSETGETLFVTGLLVQHEVMAGALKLWLR
jgi:starvation-inducible DNA-binding protein